MKASDITDVMAFAALARCRGKNGVPEWSTLRETADELPQFHRKVVLAKLKSMVKRRILNGCTCGCRGDFELPKAKP